MQSDNADGTGLLHQWEHKYTKESIEKYSVYAGVGSLLGAVGCAIMMLLYMGVLNFGFSMEGHSMKKTIMVVIILAVIVIPFLLGMPQLKKLDTVNTEYQEVSGSKKKGKSKKDDEEEDF